MKVPILIPNIFNYPFTYDSNFLNLDKGNYVTVPFGSTKITGIVWDKFEETHSVRPPRAVLVCRKQSLANSRCPDL